METIGISLYTTQQAAANKVAVSRGFDSFDAFTADANAKAMANAGGYQAQQRALGGGGLAGLSSQAGNLGAAVGLRDTVTAPGASRPMASAPGMAQPSSGLNSLATKAKKPRNITLNQMYRK